MHFGKCLCLSLVNKTCLVWASYLRKNTFNLFCQNVSKNIIVLVQDSCQLTYSLSLYLLLVGMKGGRGRDNASFKHLFKRAVVFIKGVRSFIFLYYSARNLSGHGALFIFKCDISFLISSSVFSPIIDLFCSSLTINKK